MYYSILQLNINPDLVSFSGVRFYYLFLPDYPTDIDNKLSKKINDTESSGAIYDLHY